MDWIINELINMNRRTRKILAMHRCLHTRSNVARLHLPRKDGGKGLIGIEECVKKESKSSYGYLRDSTEKMLQMVLKEVLAEEESLQDYQRSKLQKWLESSPGDGTRMFFKEGN